MLTPRKNDMKTNSDTTATTLKAIAITALSIGSIGAYGSRILVSEMGAGGYLVSICAAVLYAWACWAKGVNKSSALAAWASLAALTAGMAGGTVKSGISHVAEERAAALEQCISQASARRTAAAAEYKASGGTRPTKALEAIRATEQAQIAKCESRHSTQGASLSTLTLADWVAILAPVFIDLAAGFGVKAAMGAVAADYVAGRRRREEEEAEEAAAAAEAEAAKEAKRLRRNEQARKRRAMKKAEKERLSAAEGFRVIHTQRQS